MLKSEPLFPTHPHSLLISVFRVLMVGEIGNLKFQNPSFSCKSNSLLQTQEEPIGKLLFFFFSNLFSYQFQKFLNLILGMFLFFSRDSSSFGLCWREVDSPFAFKLLLARFCEKVRFLSHIYDYNYLWLLGLNS